MKREKKKYWVLFLLFFFGASALAFGQAPALLWSTNVGARVFAVDNQTNVYCQAGGNVIMVTGAGVPAQTNPLSSYPGIANRDSDGNLYYTGNYPGVWNGFAYNYTTPACFVAKFNADGEQL